MREPIAAVAVWLAVLAALTIGGAVWVAASGASYQDFSVAILVIGYAPALAALVAVSVQRGIGGLRTLLGQFSRWRVKPGWYAVAVLAPLVFVLAATAGVALLSGSPPRAWIVAPSADQLPALLGPIIAGSLGEELGWRGFAQPRLQLRQTALAAAVAVGAIWALWHMWPALTPDGLAQLTPADTAQTFVRLMGTAVLYAWLYNGTRGALPVVLVAHAAHNIAIDLTAPEVLDSAGGWIIAGLYAAAAVLVVVLTDPGTLTRRGRGPAPARS